MGKNAVAWFEIYVQDMPRAKAFYEAVFQIELQPLPMEGMEMETFPMHMGGEGATGSLVRMPGAPSGFAGTLVYFACDDCAVELSRVLPAGGKIEREKFSVGQYGFVAMAYDTEGNMFGLHSMT